MNTSAKCVVLAPRESHSLFAQSAPEVFVPLYYTYRKMNLGERMARRIGRRTGPRLVVEAGTDLSSVTALWLGSSVELTREETAGLLERMPRLAWVYSQRTGTEHLALDLYRDRGVTVTNTGDLTSLWVAEMHLACVLSQAKSLPGHARVQRRHGSRSVLVRELREISVLVVGTGTIGGHTARLCRGAGMRVVGASRNPARFKSLAHDYDEVIPLDEALRVQVSEVDAVILAVPMTAETRGFISPLVLDRMRPDALLVNLARPLLVDEFALVAALRAGRLGSAWMSSTESLGFWRRWRADRLPNFHLTHYSEAHVASKPRRAFEQFVSLAGRQSRGAEAMAGNAPA